MMKDVIRLPQPRVGVRFGQTPHIERHGGVVGVGWRERERGETSNVIHLQVECIVVCMYIYSDPHPYKQRKQFHNNKQHNK